MRKAKPAVAAMLLSTVFCFRCTAQNYSIDWYTIAGGGGTSSAGAYSVSGTLGQHDTGSMTGGNFTLLGGFWSFVAGVPSPGAPSLTIAFSPTNTILICWPSSSTSFVLQQNADLGSTNWVNVGTVPSNDGFVQCVAVSPLGGTLFFRLKNSAAP